LLIKILGPKQSKKLAKIGYFDVDALADEEFAKLAEQLGKIAARRIQKKLIRAGITYGKLFASS
jgi:hypothetical protein